MNVKVLCDNCKKEFSCDEDEVYGDEVFCFDCKEDLGIF